MRRSPPAPGLLLAGIATPRPRPGHAPQAGQVEPHPGEPAGPRCTSPGGARTLRRSALGTQGSGPGRRWGRVAPREELERGRARGHSVPQHTRRAPEPRGRTFLVDTRGHSRECPGARRRQPPASPRAPVPPRSVAPSSRSAGHAGPSGHKRRPPHGSASLRARGQTRREPLRSLRSAGRHTGPLAASPFGHRTPRPKLPGRDGPAAPRT